MRRLNVLLPLSLVAGLLASPAAAQAVYRYTGKLAGFTVSSSHENITLNCPDPAVQPCLANVVTRDGLHEGTIKLAFPTLLPVASVTGGDNRITLETPITPSVDTDFTFWKQPLSQPATFRWHINTVFSFPGSCSQQTPDVTVTEKTFHMTQTLPCSIGGGFLSVNAPAAGTMRITVTVSATVYRPPEPVPYANFFETIGATYDLTSAGEASSVSSIRPAVAQNDGETAEPLTALITGSKFAAGATVTIGDVAVRAVRFKNDTQLEVDLGGFKDLPDGPRDVVVKNPDGRTGKGTGLFYVSSLGIAPLEINQGVRMDCTTDVPCVADHRTVVRVKVTANAPKFPFDYLTGRLHVFEAGTTRPIAGSPFLPERVYQSAVLTYADDYYKFGALDTLNFHLKGSTTLPAGGYDFVFEVSPRNPGLPPSLAAPDDTQNLLRRATGKVFKTSLGIDVYAIPESRDPFTKDGIQRLVSLSRVGALFPTSSVFIQLLPSTTDLEEQMIMALGLQPVGYARGNPAHVLVLTDSYIVGKKKSSGVSWCGFLTEGSLEGGCLLPLGYFTSASREQAAWHLIGHDYGLGDLDNSASSRTWFEPILLTSDLNQCRPPDLCQIEEGNFDFLGPRVAVPGFPISSNMSTDFSRLATSWTDRMTWELVYGRLFAPSPVVRAPLAAQDLLVVSGSVSASGQGRFGTFARRTGEPPAAFAGDYSVELQNATGESLTSRRFSLDLSLLDALERDALPFAVHLPLAPGAARVVLKRGETGIATRAISASPPAVTLLSPNGGETLSGTTTVRWSASDPDGDALSFSLYYSTDGITWLPVRIGVSGTSYDWSTALARGTTTGRIKVVASDGFNETSATSAGPFTVAAKAPVAAILAPDDGTVVKGGTLVTLDGSAFDLEDGLLPASGLSFSSSRDGVLGAGDSVTRTLSTGTHAITLTATDSDGNEATDTITVTVVDPPAAPDETRFVPIVLSTSGVGGAFFSSELTLTNRGSKDATVEIAYTQAFGGGAGVAYDVIPAGRQKIVPDALAYLDAHGVTLPLDGNRGGTLSARFHGLSSSDAGAAMVRTATPVADGRAGLSYPAIPPQLLTGTVTIAGLRQNTTDRSNVAVMNSGGATDGDVVLRVTVVSGDPANPVSKALPDLVLAPGAFTQFSGVLGLNGLDLSNGYVKVERVSGTAPFFAYGVINDQRTSDGSFIPPVVDSSLVGQTGLTVPVIVETASFASELVATNSSTSRKTVRLAFVADAISSGDRTATLDLDLAPGEQRIVPAFVQFLRSRGVAGIGPAGPTYAGALFASVPNTDVRGLVVGVRTSSAAPAGGSYGLFYTGVPFGAAASSVAWVYGLQQNGENRANLALVNTGNVDASGSTYRIELFDGDTGALVKTLETSLSAKRWTQLSGLLSSNVPGITNAYAKVTRTAGNNQFLAYGVINDGGAPGERSGDGAFVTMEAEHP